MVHNRRTFFVAMNSSHAINTGHALRNPHRKDWVGWKTAGPARCLWPASQAGLEQKLAPCSTDVPGHTLLDLRAASPEAHNGLQDKPSTTDPPNRDVQSQGPTCAYPQGLILEQQGKSMMAGPAPLTALWPQVCFVKPLRTVLPALWHVSLQVACNVQHGTVTASHSLTQPRAQCMQGLLVM